MAEYSSSGLWDADKGGEIKLDELKLSSSTKKIIEKWINEYSKRVNWDNPNEEIDLTKSQREKYSVLEDRVFEQLEKELGKNNTLIFHSRK